MLQKEFEERVGYNVSEEDFGRINEMYLESGQDMDKDTFCEDFKKHGDSVLLAIFFNRVGVLEDKLDSKRNDINSLVNCLLKNADKYDDDEMNNKAIQVIGESEVIRRKLAFGLSLTDSEREYVIANWK